MPPEQPILPVTPPQAPPPVPQTSHKLLWVIGLILLILGSLSAYGFYFYKPVQNTQQIQNTATSTWQTYRNEEYGFEFKYPKNFILTEELTIERNLSSIDLKKSTSSVDEAFRLIIYHNEKSSEVTEIQFAHNYNPYGDHSNEKQYINESNFFQNGNRVYKYTQIFKFSSIAHQFFIKDNIGVDASYIVNHGSVGENPYTSIFEQVLSTFKFIEPQVSNPEVPSSVAVNAQIIFADKLASCTTYKTTFKHPMTGETMEKEILGIMNGKCHYIEQMPNNGRMECKYSENERLAVAQFTKDIANAESVGTKINITNITTGEYTGTYTINGKVVSNPLQEVMKSGVCIVSGY